MQALLSAELPKPLPTTREEEGTVWSGKGHFSVVVRVTGRTGQ